MQELLERTLNNLLNKVICRSRAISCVIVDSANNIIGMGTNNPDPNMSCVDYTRSLGYDFEDDGRCPRYILGFKSGKGLHLCRARHAERESIKDAESKGFDVKGTRMFMTCECPCVDCATAIVKSGISEINIVDKPDYDTIGREVLVKGGVLIKTWKLSQSPLFGSSFPI